jgi:signal peptidase I
MSDLSAEPVSKRPSRLRRFFHFARNVLAVVGLLFIIYHAGFNLSVVLSPSMSPTLRGGGDQHEPSDWVLAENVSYWFRSPRRFEVVCFRSDDGVDVMKRVAGLPNETVGVKNFWVTINGIPPDRPPQLASIKYFGFGRLLREKTCPCGPNGYFVLGDDSKDSQDSRFDGPVDGSRIRARAWLIVWPPKRIGFVR